MSRKALTPAEYGHFCALPDPATPDDVIHEARDGEHVLASQFNAVESKLKDDKEPMFFARDINGHALITDSRVAVACSKYDKSGDLFSVGGAFARARAVHRRRQKMLVGHVRYPWLRGVHARNKGGLLSGDPMLRLSLNLTAAKESRTFVEIYFPKSVDAVSLATEVIVRAARFRLAHEPDLDTPDRGEEKAELERLASHPGLSWERGGDAVAGESFNTGYPLDDGQGVLLGSAVSELPRVAGGFGGFKVDSPTSTR